MGRRLTATVLAKGRVYPAGTTDTEVPAGVAIPADVWDGDPDPTDSEAEPAEPPRAGQGATTDAWRTYATAVGVTVPDGAGRDDIIAAVDNARS